LSHKCGRVWTSGSTEFLDASCKDAPQAGFYRITFHPEPYLKSKGVPVFYPLVPITFVIPEDQIHEHFHIPLLLSPFGYSTYRGS
ncbi:hypothetical protein CYMTET_24667, partial [Cymbomonas tetramitiformis]